MSDGLCYKVAVSRRDQLYRHHFTFHFSHKSCGGKSKRRYISGSICAINFNFFYFWISRQTLECSAKNLGTDIWNSSRVSHLDLGQHLQGPPRRTLVFMYFQTINISGEQRNLIWLGWRCCHRVRLDHFCWLLWAAIFSCIVSTFIFFWVYKNWWREKNQARDSGAI
jgi:hypothetical protein